MTTGTEATSNEKQDPHLLAIAAIQRAHDAITARIERRGRINQDLYMELRRSLPYCITPAPGGRILLLNRDYKPIGLPNPYSDWVRYERYPELTVAISEDKYAALSWNRTVGALWHDGIAPWHNLANARAYRDRLHLLMRAVGMKCTLGECAPRW